MQGTVSAVGVARRARTTAGLGAAEVEWHRSTSGDGRKEWQSSGVEMVERLGVVSAAADVES
jgi:hypothetical protein